ncbi:B-cell receptor CD22-like [Centropristis striata]|uniref:B-cell receptor CD22-like n=1 Tax=Centropristis striata TaxID=184440 RepID=UPI0027DFEA83|nr:B-cell receptor CD22-like [Centropristis striata]
MMAGSREGTSSYFCFSLNKITPRNVQSNNSACFSRLILTMESLILIILLVMPGVWSEAWKVTFEDQCALKGTSVVIKCKYEYPSGQRVTEGGWYRAKYVYGRRRLSRLSTPSTPPDHFKFVGNAFGDCSLKVNGVQHRDEGAYAFGFVTTHDRWTSKSSAYLSVTELTAVVQPRTVTEGDNVSLTCMSGCPTHVNTVWFRDGQRVQNPVFQAGSEDAGRYHCAVLGQEMVRSASRALNVLYAPSNVTLSVSPSVAKGSLVTLTCSSDANPPVTHSGYSLYKGGLFISSGQNHTISDIQLSHNGLYYCQATNNISRRGINLINSTELHLDVQYRPENISILMDPPHVVEGSSVILTCSSVANPAADNYTWYRSTVSSSMLQVGSGQVLSLSSVDASHTGLYLCMARNQLGENNSTEMLLAVKEKYRGGQTLITGIGVSIFATLVFALLLFWLKQRTRAEKKQTVYEDPRSSASEDPSNSIYANIYTLPTCPPPAAQDIIPRSQRHHEHDAPESNEDEVTYSTVTIKPRNPSLPHRMDHSRAPHDSWSTAGEDDNSVIYASLAKSS